MKMIDKDALVAEIKRRLNLYDPIVGYEEGRKDEAKSILSFLNTLEVKEANLDKERITAEIKRRLDEWRYHASTEAKYRCEAYAELLEWINDRLVEPAFENSEEAEHCINQTQKEKQ